MANMDRAGYNSIGSPMHLYEDGELLTKDELRRRREEALNVQEKKPPFLVGTMAEVSQKIGDLDRSLQDYTQLVFDSRLSETDDSSNQYHIRGGTASAKYRRKEMEKLELSRFSGIYSIHSAVGQAPERVKNVHKISMKEKKKERKKSAEAESGRAKPKFVELFTFPGYQSSTLTPLPHNITSTDIFIKVIKAQQEIKRKVPTFDEEYSNILQSYMAQAILLDSYWWIFLDKFSNSNKSFQSNFFNRISHNYVKFLLHIQSYSFREAILNNFPDTIAQSVYVAFCETFPDSYKQFNDDFKDYLLQLLYEWMTGILPAPRKFLRWNPDLEPIGKKREAAMGKKPVKESKKAQPADDWLTQIDNFSSMQKGMKHFGSEVSIASRATSHNTNRSRRGRGQGSDSSKSEESRHIDSVADAQQRAKFPKPPASTKALTPVIETSQGPLSLVSDPIKEDIEEEKSVTYTNSASKIHTRTKSHVARGKTAKGINKNNVMKSHPACKGPDMVRSLFDTRGSCPLVVNYLKSHSLDSDSGQQVNVYRTEMKNLPPLDAPTYKDVIKDTLKSMRKLEKDIHRHIDRDMMQHSSFVVQQNKRTQLHRRKQKLLLSDSKEVKRLSNLLMIESAAQREKSEKAAAAEKLDEIFELALMAAGEQLNKTE